MTDDHKDFWETVKAEAIAAVEKPSAPAQGCACAPQPGREKLCDWCSLTEAERERLRSDQK